MGKSWSSGSLTSEMVEEYAELTYLSRAEIVHIYQRFQSANPGGRERIPMPIVVEEFRELKFNPFRDRIFEVFSSRKDGCLSFEDVLDMASVFSKSASPEVKAAWAFRIFDVDGDNELGPNDINNILTRITYFNDSNSLTRDEKDFVIKNPIVLYNVTDERASLLKILEELDIDRTGYIAPMEFAFAVSKDGSLLSNFHLTF